MANCNHGPLHAPIMGNTPVGICTKQYVEVAVIHSYHPILRAISTLLPSRYHIPFCLLSILCPIMSTGCCWRKREVGGQESNSSALEFFFGIVLPFSCCSHLSFIIASLSFVICHLVIISSCSSSSIVHHLAVVHHLSFSHHILWLGVFNLLSIIMASLCWSSYS